MSTYDNLNIAQATLIFDTNGNPSVGAGEFDLSTMAFLPNVPLIDQVEVERVFDTGADTKFGANVFTVADRREMFIFPKNWYTINEQTKILKFIDLNTVPTRSSFDPFVYYPLSRSYKLILPDAYGNIQFIDIPPVLNTTSGGPPVRQYDKVYIRRKTPSINSIVTFAPGTRLTTTQLNLQFDQLKNIIQELLAKVKNEIILKYDENAIDGPFLGNTDLKMNNNFIKDAGTKQIIETLTIFTGLDNIPFSGGSVTPNVLAVNNAVTKGSLYRTGLVASPASFTGDFTTRLPDSATNYKITNLAPGTAATDAVNLSQLNNADNLTTGTVGVDRLPINIPLAKLSSATGQVYTLPLENLPNTLTIAAGPFGANPASNTGNMLYGNVNSKGLLTSISSRNMTVDDLPTVSTITAQAYGGTGKLLSLTTDTKGRITLIAANNIVNADLPTSTVSQGTYGSDSATNALAKFTVNTKGIITSASHRSITVADLPTTSVTGAGSYGQATAGNANNMLQITYDTAGRVTSASHRAMGTGDLPSGIPLSKLSGTNDGFTLPTDAIGNTSIVLGKINFAAGGTIPTDNLPNINLANINASNRGTFVLPEEAVPLVPSTNTAASTWNTLPVKDFKVDAKGRIFDVSHRAFTDGDIGAISANKITSGVLDDGRIPAPSPAPTANTYGSASAIPTITVDAKGRITTISTASLDIANVSGVDTAVNSLIDTRALSRGTTAVYNAGNRVISNVNDPAASKDVVNLQYFQANALVAVGGSITAGNKILTGLGTPALNAAQATDAVNFGLLQSVVNTGTLIGSTVPQVYRLAVGTAAATPTIGGTTYNQYSYSFVDTVNPLMGTTSSMLLVEVEGSTIKFTPQLAAPTSSAFNGYFYLQDAGTTKTVYVYTTSALSGFITIRNFGLSRLVSGAAATTSAQGIVSILNNGGITVNAGEISLTTATSSQLGGIKIGTGLSISSGTASVKLTDSKALADSTTAASATAVKETYDYAVSGLSSTNSTVSTLSGTVTSVQTTANAALPKAGGTMTGPLALASGTNIPLKFTAATPTSPTDGSMWYASNTLNMQTGSGPKTIAFTDSTLTGSAAAANKWTTGMNLALGGDLTGNVTFDGSTGVTLNATIANNSVALGTDTTGNYVATVTAGDGITVTGTGETAAVTVTNSDRGSLQTMFKRITGGSTEVTADANNSSLTISAGTGITVTGNNSTKTITITNSTTPPNTFGTVAVTGTAGQDPVVANTSAATLTLNAGTGMSITTNVSTDVITLANTGLISISGTANRVSASTTSGVVTLTGPQDIHTGASPTFAGATLGSIVIAASAANTLTTGSNLDLILDPNGTGKISLLANVDCSTNTLTAGASTLGTLSCDAITFKTTGTKLKLGATASTVEAISTTSAGVYNAGDVVLRVPASGKAFLIANPTTAPDANTELMTRSAVNSAVSSAIAGGNLMPAAGTVHTAAQTLGCSVDSFSIQTGSSPVNRLTIANSGAATFTNALAVNGGVTLDNTLAVTGTTTFNNAVTISSDYNVTAGKAPSAVNHLTNKYYVDTSLATKVPTSEVYAYTDYTLSGSGAKTVNFSAFSISVGQTKYVTTDLKSASGSPDITLNFVGTTTNDLYYIHFLRRLSGPDTTPTIPAAPIFAKGTTSAAVGSYTIGTGTSTIVEYIIQRLR